MTADFTDFVYKRSHRGTWKFIDVCRMAAYIVQNGKCYVSGRDLLPNKRQLHHRLPRQYGGQDTPENLVYLESTVHRMVHTESFEDFYELSKKVSLTDQQLQLLNQLRLEARCKPVDEWKGGDSHDHRNH